MDELHSHGTFPNARSYALNGAMSDVSNGKNSGNVRLQQEGIALESPSFWPLAVPEQIGAGADESTFIAFDYVAQPVCARQRADKDEQRLGRDGLALARLAVTDHDAREAGLATGLHNLAVRAYHDVGLFLDLVDEVLRHAGGERRACATARRARSPPERPDGKPR